MRDKTDAAKVSRLMQALGHAARGPGRVYLVGGATAVLVGWRTTTVDVDLKFSPEPAGIFDGLQAIKDALNINIELAAPDDFVPPLPGWENRSEFIGKYGQVEFFHYDYYGQALAKIARGHVQDVADVHAMAQGGLFDPRELRRLFESVRTDLKRYPALDPDILAGRIDIALAELERQSET